MVRIQQANECKCSSCPGHISVGTGEFDSNIQLFGGMFCLCPCHKTKDAA